MAAGGGTFLVHNKVLPGAYINFVSKARAIGTLGERGVVAMPFVSSWGKEKEVVELTAEDFQTNTLRSLGYDYTADEVKDLREVFCGAKTVLLYRLGTSTQAKATAGNLTVTAKCGGVRGNDIKVVISLTSTESEEDFTVSTYVGTILVDSCEVKTIEDLTNNDFVTFSGTGVLTENAGIILSGGKDAEITGADYSEFLSKIEAESFTTLLYAGNDDTIKSLFTAFTKRLRDDEGYKISCVLADYNKADHEGIISVINTVSEEGKSLVYWVAGKTAGAEVNESLLNALYDGELTPNVKQTKSQLREHIENGHFAFYADTDGARVLKDINTFTNFEPEKNSDFSLNQVIRVLDSIANDTARIFSDYYMGKVQNNENGRNLFKAELVNYHNQLQSIDAITNFDIEDITVSKGTEKGDVVVNEYIEPVAAMEKLYMTCIIE